MSSNQKISGLYTLIETGNRPDLDPFACARSFLKGGAKIVQLREKEKPFPERLKLARKISALKKEFIFIFLINDSVEIALEVNADGVHLGQSDSSVAEARKKLGPEKIIGRSTHSLEEALKAAKEEVDYIAAGAVFPTTSKPAGHTVIGLEGLRQIVEAVSLPVVAIGGIGRSNIRQVLATGVQSAAMISALSQARDITREVAFFLEIFREVNIQWRVDLWSKPPAV